MSKRSHKDVLWMENRPADGSD